MFKPEIKRYERVTSTQDICREQARLGAAEGLVVLADEQTAGRGRAGYAWYSPPGQALYASILLRPPLALPEVSWITMIAALAVIDTINVLKPGHAVAPAIKWFNDVMLDDKKVCGVLVETASSEGQLDHVILGIGLNVNTDFADAPPDVHARATSLAASLRPLEGAFAREPVLQLLLTHFSRRYDALCQTGQSPASDYTRYLDTLGKRVRLQMGTEQLEGLAVGIDALGGLRLRTIDGERVAHFGHVLSVE